MDKKYNYTLINRSGKVLVLGSRGLVGSALVRILQKEGYKNILTPIRPDLNLLKQQDVLDYFLKHKPDHVFLAAARVGGIYANNTYPADFIFENLAIECNVFNAAFTSKVKKLLFLGSSCIYPRDCLQPIKEEYLLTGPLEKTNDAYAIAKIAGLKMAECYRKQYGCEYYSVMPTNLYGVNDNYDEKNSHVIPGLIARMYKAIKEGDDVFEIWGTGKPRREFLYVDDMADACIFLMNMEKAIPDHINIGTGTDITVIDLAHMIASKLGFNGELRFNTEYPDGTMRKCLDVSKLFDLGWRPKVSLEEGLDRSIEFFIRQQEMPSLNRF